MALLRSRAAGEETTALDDDLCACNVENSQGTDNAIFYVQVCTEDKNANNERTTGKTDEDPVKMEEARVRTVQPADHRTTRGEVPTMA